MPHQYEARRGRRRAGPFDWTGLRHHVEAGRISPSDFIRDQNSPYWVLADSVPGLFEPGDVTEPGTEAAFLKVVPAPPPLPQRPTSELPNFPPRETHQREGKVVTADHSPEPAVGQAPAEDGMTRREWWHPILLIFCGMSGLVRLLQWLRKDKKPAANPPQAQR